ncbi:hypothetical protein [Vibrio phage vB_VibM_10AMN]|uniref:HNH homing endonuclease n=1 Tax=Staphylococcus phage vB_VibM_10AMN12 TaxID=3076785 RepID=A0AA96KSZ6_9CAUD|nr:hypothetical protein [Vibrio phage vB_VibM_10AMN]WNO47466.1 HNH homing endonuclease [Staphylococcus phage vB_VibM_10AMN12]
MKKIEGFDYFITEDGSLINSKGYKIKGRVNLDGYHTYHLWKDGVPYTRRRGRLVAEYYIPNPCNLPVVDHIDGDRLNDSIDNLEWVTTLENNLRSIEKFPERHKKNTVLDYETVHGICKLLELDLKNKEVADKFNVGIDVVKKIRNGISWKDVSKDYNIPRSRRSQYTREQAIRACELINQGYSNKEIENLTNGEFKSTWIKRIRARKTYKDVSTEYLKV